MGYDCTLHVIDEAMIRERFVPRLLNGSAPPGEFDRRDDANELWTRVREALTAESPEVAASYICQLAIAYCAAELPYHYERGFCLSLWPELPNLAAMVPPKLTASSETTRAMAGNCGRDRLVDAPLNAARFEA